jgi:hypothetical protein
MSSFLKFASMLTSSDIKRLQMSTPASRTKVVALGLAVLIPSTIWVVCSFLLTYSVLNMSFVASLVSALVLGFLVITIERLIVMGNGNWIVSLFRTSLALVVAYLGAQLFDLVLFKNDIDHMLPKLRHEEALKTQTMIKEQWEERYQLKEKENNVQAKWTQFQLWQTEANNEAAGLSSNKIKGAGSATKFKQGVADDAKQDYATDKAELDAINQESIAKQSQAYDSAFNNFDSNSILYRIKAMNQLIQGNSEMKGLYIGVTAFLFLIEFMVLIFKLTWPKTAYEEEVAMLEQLHRQRNQRQKPHHVIPGLKQVSKSLQARLNTLL